VDESEVLRLAASLDQASAHIVAQALVAEARARALPLTFPAQPDETPGQGMTGLVDGRAVAVGSASFIESLGLCPPAINPTPGVAHALVAIDGRVAGILHVRDQLRAESVGLARRLRDVGVERVLLVTGDRSEVAAAVGAAADVDEVYADMSAEAKLELVRALRTASPESHIAMVGDGINDAPALALADTGIAIGATATIATQTADAVVVSERVDRTVDAIRISRRSMRIARQSVVAGLGLSVFGMLLALAGLLQPVAGALAQEVIDVAVILNALRALGD
jgi:P-type E1-E2 ATPase